MFNTYYVSHFTYYNIHYLKYFVFIFELMELYTPYEYVGLAIGFILKIKQKNNPPDIRTYNYN